MDRFDHVIEALCALALARVDASIYGRDIWDEPHLAVVEKAIGHASAVAQIDASTDLSSDLQPFDDQVLDDQYNDVFEMLSVPTLMEQSHPSNPSGHMLYCPRGCNQLWTTSGYDECGACGQTMSPDHEDTYYDSLAAAGQCL